MEDLTMEGCSQVESVNSNNLIKKNPLVLVLEAEKI